MGTMRSDPEISSDAAQKKPKTIGLIGALASLLIGAYAISHIDNVTSYLAAAGTGNSACSKAEATVLVRALVAEQLLWTRIS
jgi:hypothetical protein